MGSFSVALTRRRAWKPSNRAIAFWCAGLSIPNVAEGFLDPFVPPRRALSIRQQKEPSDSSFEDLLDDIAAGRSFQQTNLNIDSTLRERTKPWQTFHWSDTKVEAQEQQRENEPPSTLESILVNDRLISIKRDDLLRLPGSQISGNKARKMFALHTIDSKHFPADCVVSYGGPQSNAMLAIAAAIRFHNEERGSHDEGAGGDPIRFVYYTKTLPKYLRKQTTGNLFRALALGMELRQISSTEYHNLFGGAWGGCESPPENLDPPSAQSLWIPQGGACRMAVAGVNSLAAELCEQTADNTPTTVVVPGGTCTTAVLLQRALRNESHLQVAVIPCVGDALYAERQMIQLLRQLDNTATLQHLPQILCPDPSGSVSSYFAFGSPHRDILETFRYMEQEHDLELDLLYGAPAWTVLLRHLKASSSSPLHGRRIIYVHTGGLEGVHTQLLRYKYKGLLHMDDMVLQSKRLL